MRHDFDSNADMLSQFSAPETALDCCEVLHAAYEEGDYEGDAWVVYRDLATGTLYEVGASHCSCYGLEGQWQPEATSLEAIHLRPASLNYGYPGLDEFKAEFPLPETGK